MKSPVVVGSQKRRENGSVPRECKEEVKSPASIRRKLGLKWRTSLIPVVSCSRGLLSISRFLLIFERQRNGWLTAVKREDVPSMTNALAKTSRIFESLSFMHEFSIAELIVAWERREIQCATTANRSIYRTLHYSTYLFGALVRLGWKLRSSWTRQRLFLIVDVLWCFKLFHASMAMAICIEENPAMHALHMHHKKEKRSKHENQPRHRCSRVQLHALAHCTVQ